MAARPPFEGDGLVLVHLSDIPEQRRTTVAERMIRVAGLQGTAAIELRMAAVFPRQDPAILVTPAQARKVGVR